MPQKHFSEYDMEGSILPIHTKEAIQMLSEEKKKKKKHARGFFYLFR